MTTSQQATGRASERNDNYPWLCKVLAEHSDGTWTVQAIFEWETWAGAVMAGNDCIAGPFDPGVVSMHYYVGEVG